jgi:HAD superfamily phosphatase
MDGAFDRSITATSPPIAYLGDTVADVLTVQRARKQCPDARFLSLAVAPPHLHAPEAVQRRAAYEARLIEAGADVVLPSTQALEPEALFGWLNAPSR